MTTITISGGASKQVQVGDNLIFNQDYLSPENEDQSVIVSFDGAGKPQCNVIPQGGGTKILISLEPSSVIAIWRPV